MDKQVKLRQSNFELLRIIAMLMIIAHHFSVHGGFSFPIDSITVNRLWIQLISLGGKIGVNIFVLISGWFLVTAQNIKTSKVLKLWLQIFTYSVLIVVVFMAVGIQSFSVKQLIKSLFPITYVGWWFASSYFVLFLISPFVNILLKTLDKKNYQKMLVLLTIFWCIIPTFLEWYYESNNLLWFIYLYALAGYIRLHGKNTKITGNIYLIGALILSVLTFLSAVLFDYLTLKFSFFASYITYFYDMQRLPVVLISVCMFLGFMKMDIGYIKIINLISSATFGVYLIHDNKYVRQFLWNNVFKNASFSESGVLIPYSIAVIAIVFVASTAVELLRIHLIERCYMNILYKSSCYIDNIKEKFFNKI